MSNFFDQYAVPLILVVALMLCITLFFSRSCNEKFDIGNNYCTDFSNDVNICLGYAEDSCNYCADNQICFPKYSTYNDMCHNVLTSVDYNQNYPYIADLYNSTTRYFDWNDWYKYHNYFPPFIYKGGSYYFNPTTLPANDPAKNKYAFLVHNGVRSKRFYQISTEDLSEEAITDENNIIKFSENEITMSIKNIKSLGIIGDKIIGSLNQPNSQINLEKLAEGFKLYFLRPIIPSEEVEPSGVSSSCSVVSIPANIDNIPTRSDNISRGLI